MVKRWSFGSVSAVEESGGFQEDSLALQCASELSEKTYP